MSRLNSYSSLIFDCDGVLLNSNAVKSDAFYTIALPYGEIAAEHFLKYHIANGGISRFKKIDFLFSDVLRRPAEPGEKKQLLEQYSEIVWKGLLTCDIAEGLKSLRNRTANARWLVVSGGMQSELRELLKLRKIDHFFDGGIFGSPDDKDTILKAQFQAGNLQVPALFLGDSEYDYLAATRADLDFILVTNWSEDLSWSVKLPVNKIGSVNELIG